jgi:hypothetical protein
VTPHVSSVPPGLSILAYFSPTLFTPSSLSLSLFFLSSRQFLFGRGRKIGHAHAPFSSVRYHLWLSLSHFVSFSPSLFISQRYQKKRWFSLLVHKCARARVCVYKCV